MPTSATIGGHKLKKNDVHRAANQGGHRVGIKRTILAFRRESPFSIPFYHGSLNNSIISVPNHRTFVLCSYFFLKAGHMSKKLTSDQRRAKRKTARIVIHTDQALKATFDKFKEKFFPDGSASEASEYLLREALTLYATGLDE